MNSPSAEEHAGQPQKKPAGPARRAILHGLGIVMPPLLTILLFVWAWNTTQNYVLSPLESIVRHGLVWTLSETYENAPPQSRAVKEGSLESGFIFQKETFVPDPTGRKFLPKGVVDYVDENLNRLGPNELPPATATSYWHRYAQLKWLPRSRVIPIFLILFLTLLYFLGRMFAHRIGRLFVKGMDGLILRLPLVSNVYSSVKQVTDFVFSERDIEFNRVVAVEYPRKGMWSIGFVTGQSMADIGAAANEPVLSVLMPTSPMPFTGFTVTIRKSEAIDLDLTIDQAIQFCVSCGVVVPPQQQQVTSKIQLNLPERKARDSQDEPSGAGDSAGEQNSAAGKTSEASEN